VKKCGYKTGEVARICELKPAQARRLLDKSGVEICFVESRYKRQTTRRVSPKALIEFMAKYKFCFDQIPPEDITAHRALLSYRYWQLQDLIEKAKKRGDIFRKINKSPDIFHAIFYDGLGSRKDPGTIEKNRLWARVFYDIADLIEYHTKVCKTQSKRLRKRLSSKFQKFQILVEKAAERCDILSQTGSSSCLFSDLFLTGLGSLDDRQGMSRNNAWAKVFRAFGAVIDQHIMVCQAYSKN